MALPSFMSVHIRSERTLLGADERDVCVIAGTGFVVQHDAQTFLITNGHIVTGRHRITDKYLGLPALPQRLVVTVPMAGEGLGGDGVALLGTTQLVVDLYDENDDGAAQMARSLKKFRERANALEQQREDIDGALIELREACARLERRLAEIRPDLLPRAADYDQVLRARLDGHADAAMGK